MSVPSIYGWRQLYWLRGCPIGQRDRSAGGIGCYRTNIRRHRRQSSTVHDVQVWGLRQPTMQLNGARSRRSGSGLRELPGKGLLVGQKQVGISFYY